jgi:hypothetical protein
VVPALLAVSGDSSEEDVHGEMAGARGKNGEKAIKMDSRSRLPGMTNADGFRLETGRNGGTKLNVRLRVYEESLFYGGQRGNARVCIPLDAF